MRIDEIKSCPFCGGKGEIVRGRKRVKDIRVPILFKVYPSQEYFLCH